MNNIVEFALRLRDMASQPLRQFGASASQAFNRANQMTTNLTSRNRVLGQSYNELQAQIRQVENTIRTSTIPSQIRAARRELEALQRQSNRHAGNIGGSGAASGRGGSGSGMMGMFGGVGGMLKGAGIGLAIGGIAALGGVVSDSIEKSLERQKIQTSFNVLAGSEQKGGSLTKQLVGLQKDTILGSEVFQNAQTMMGFGFKSEEVYGNLKMLGDVSMGNKERLQALTLAFSQTRAAGKLTGQDLLQYINAGFNPLEQLQKTLGKSMPQLLKMKEAGEISFGMVKQAFVDATSEGGKFNNMLEQIAQTPAGKMEQLRGRWDEFKVSAGTAFMPLVSMVLDFAERMMPMIEGFITPLTTGIQNAVTWIKQARTATGGWMDYVNVIKDLFVNSILPYITKVWNAIVGMVTKLSEFIGKSELLKDIFKAVGWLAEVIVYHMGKMIDGLVWLFDNVVMPILDSIEKAYKWIKDADDTGSSKTIKIQRTSNLQERKEQQTTQQLLTDIAGNTATNADASKKNESTISGGGQKVVNITVAKFLDNINITAMNMKEGEADVEKIFLELFGRVLVQGGGR